MLLCYSTHPRKSNIVSTNPRSLYILFSITSLYRDAVYINRVSRLKICSKQGITSSDVCNGSWLVRPPRGPGLRHCHPSLSACFSEKKLETTGQRTSRHEAERKSYDSQCKVAGSRAHIASHNSNPQSKN